MVDKTHVPHQNNVRQSSYDSSSLHQNRLPVELEFKAKSTESLLVFGTQIKAILMTTEQIARILALACSL